MIVLVPYNMVANFLDPEGVFSAPALLAGLWIYNLHTLTSMLGFLNISIATCKNLFLLIFPTVPCCLYEIHLELFQRDFFYFFLGGGAYHPWDLKTLFVLVRRKRSILKESRPPPSYGTIHDYLDIEDGFSLLGNV